GGVHTLTNPAVLPIGMPNGPYGLTANGAVTGGVSLAFYDNADNEAAFVVERSPAGSSAFTPIATLPMSPGVGQRVTYTDVTASVGTPYTYRVYAVNGPYQSSV